MRRCAGTGTAVLRGDEVRRVLAGLPVCTRRSGGVWVAGMWLSSSWSTVNVAGHGSRPVSVTTEEPALVPMSEAERAAAVSVRRDPRGLVDRAGERGIGATGREPLSQIMIDALFCR